MFVQIRWWFGTADVGRLRRIGRLPIAGALPPLCLTAHGGGRTHLMVIHNR